MINLKIIGLNDNKGGKYNLLFYKFYISTSLTPADAIAASAAVPSKYHNRIIQPSSGFDRVCLCLARISYFNWAGVNF